MITTEPDKPGLEANFTISCQIKADELLRPSGMIFLQLPNGSILSDHIVSPQTLLAFEIVPFTFSDTGKYYCNASVISPEFPEVGLRIFEGINLELPSK